MEQKFMRHIMRAEKVKFVFQVVSVTAEDLRKDFSKWYPFLKDGKLDYLVKHNQFLGYVTDNEKSTTGVLLFSELDDFPYVWNFGHVNVDDAYKRNKLGSKLVKYTESFIKQSGGKKIIVFVSETNTIAQKFYSSLGYEREARIKNMKLGKEDIFIYSKELQE